MDHLPVLAAVAATQLLAAASPGPTFVVVTGHATGGSRRMGLQAAAGVLAATATWACLAALGLGAVVARLPLLYTALQLAGAAYLVLLGVRMVFGALRGGGADAAAAGPRPGGGWAAARAGFLTNINNPKSVAYYASLFAVMVPQAAPPLLFGSAMAVALLVSAAWWVAVALLFSLPPVRRAYGRARRAIRTPPAAF